jgi:F-type H+-transporting ATPase subunit epsilon
MPLHFELVTPAALVRSEEVHSVTVPGAEGDFTVLEWHAPFMSTVKSGELLITRTAGGEAERVAVEGGFAEVHAAGLTVLAEKAG